MKKETLLKTILYNLANRLLSDTLYTKLKYRRNLRHWPDLKNPKTFNEKLCWLKLNFRDPIMSIMVDKAASKDYVASIIGEEYVIPTLGLWEKEEDIDFESLPKQFVIKGTHDSGRVIICRDKAKLDFPSIRKEMRLSLNRDFYAITREWPYKNVPHRIIAETYLQQSDGDLIDYKFFCFNGYVDCVMVCLDRNKGDTKFYFFDKDWNLLRINQRGLLAPKNFSLPRPDGIEKMFDLASKLSEGYPFLRVDFYNVDGKIYFGELTFFPDGGVDANLLPETEKRWGDLIDFHLIKSIGSI